MSSLSLDESAFKDMMSFFTGLAVQVLMTGDEVDFRIDSNLFMFGKTVDVIDADAKVAAVDVVAVDDVVTVIAATGLAIGGVML